MTLSHYLYISTAFLNRSSVLGSGLASFSHGKTSMSCMVMYPRLPVGGHNVLKICQRRSSHRSCRAFTWYSKKRRFMLVHSNGVRSRKSPNPSPITPTPKLNSSSTSYFFFQPRGCRLRVRLPQCPLNNRGGRWCNQ